MADGIDSGDIQFESTEQAEIVSEVADPLQQDTLTDDLMPGDSAVISDPSVKNYLSTTSGTTISQPYSTDYMTTGGGDADLLNTPLFDGDSLPPQDPQESLEDNNLGFDNVLEVPETGLENSIIPGYDSTSLDAVSTGEEYLQQPEELQPVSVDDKAVAADAGTPLDDLDGAGYGQEIEPMDVQSEQPTVDEVIRNIDELNQLSAPMMMGNLAPAGEEQPMDTYTSPEDDQVVLLPVPVQTELEASQPDDDDTGLGIALDTLDDTSQSPGGLSGNQGYDEVDAGAGIVDPDPADSVQSVGEEDTRDEDEDFVETIQAQTPTAVDETEDSVHAPESLPGDQVLMFEAVSSPDEQKGDETSVTEVLEEPSVTDEILEEPGMTDELLEQPSVADEVLEEPGVADEVLEPGVTDELLEQPSVADEVLEEPGVADEVLESGMTDELLEEPSVADEVLKEPDVTDEVLKEPDATDELLEQPDVTDEVLEEPDATDELLEELSVTDELLEQPSVTDELLEQPGVTDELLEEPSIADKVLEEPHMTDKLLEEPSVADALVPDETTDTAAELTADATVAEEDLAADPEDARDDVADDILDSPQANVAEESHVDEMEAADLESVEAQQQADEATQEHTESTEQEPEPSPDSDTPEVLEDVAMETAEKDDATDAVQTAEEQETSMDLTEQPKSPAEPVDQEEEKSKPDDSESIDDQDKTDLTEDDSKLTESVKDAAESESVKSLDDKSSTGDKESLSPVAKSPEEEKPQSPEPDDKIEIKDDSGESDTAKENGDSELSIKIGSVQGSTDLDGPTNKVTTIEVEDDDDDVTVVGTEKIGDAKVQRQKSTDTADTKTKAPDKKDSKSPQQCIVCKKDSQVARSTSRKQSEPRKIYTEGDLEEIATEGDLDQIMTDVDMKDAPQVESLQAQDRMTSRKQAAPKKQTSGLKQKSVPMKQKKQVSTKLKAKETNQTVTQQKKQTSNSGPASGKKGKNKAKTSPGNKTKLAVKLPVTKKHSASGDPATKGPKPMVKSEPDGKKKSNIVQTPKSCKPNANTNSGNKSKSKTPKAAVKKEVLVKGELDLSNTPKTRRGSIEINKPTPKGKGQKQIASFKTEPMPEIGKKKKKKLAELSNPLSTPSPSTRHKTRNSLEETSLIVNKAETTSKKRRKSSLSATPEPDLPQRKRGRLSLDIINASPSVYTSLKNNNSPRNINASTPSIPLTGGGSHKKTTYSSSIQTPLPNDNPEMMLLQDENLEPRRSGRDRKLTAKAADWVAAKQQQQHVSPQPNQSIVPIISDVVSLAEQVGPSIQPKPASQVVTKVAPHVASTGTITQHIIITPSKPKSVKNKSLLCKPYCQTKATSCRPHTQTKCTQTDGDGGWEAKAVLIPVPVPVYVPTPMAMYSTPVPYPIPIPVPIPIPCFIPTTKKSADGILKHIKEIQEKMPADPFEAELLMMAEAVATADKSESESSDESEDDAVPLPDTKPEPLEFQPDESPIPGAPNELGEDMLQMALRMATEISDEPAMDLEDSLHTTTVQPMGVEPHSEFSTIDQSSEILSTSPRGGRRGGRRGRPRGRPKRTKYNEEPENTSISEAELPIEQRPAPDANMVLKYTYGVNAWKHWVVQKNTQLEAASKGSRGKLKLFKTDMLACTADELNYSLCLFVKEVRKPNGEEYAADSIFYLTLGLQQYLYENGRIDNIFADIYYERFTECLNEVLMGYEVRLNAHGLLVCRIEEEHLWESKQLGAHSPYILLNTLIYFNTRFFMLRSAEDHLRLSFSHIMKHWKRANGQPISTKHPAQAQGAKNVYLRYYAPVPHSGAEAGQKRKREEAPVYEQAENTENPLRCPVKLYEFYLSKCPESIKNRNDVFYLTPERSCVPDSPVWYSTAALGIDCMNKMLNRLRVVREIQESVLQAQPIYQ